MGRKSLTEVVAALRLNRVLAEALLEEARRALPNECCGLLGGHGRQVTRVFPATNQLASPVAYEISPRELFEIFRRLRAETIELVGIYHSHPTGDNSPSGRDCERAYYDVPYVIISPDTHGTHPVRAFLFAGDAVSELEVELTS